MLQRLVTVTNSAHYDGIERVANRIQSVEIVTDSAVASNGQINGAG